MAVASSSASKSRRVSEEQKAEKNTNSITKKELKLQRQSENMPPAKRIKSPGVRVHHGRIYDSTNGKTCHQCRQKTMDFAAYCKNQKDNGLCTMKFCQKCLLNRYGEKAEEVEALESWSCPKCRGICNCSNCMKKRGHQPTGQLIQTAKLTGFSSVSELLHVKGPQNFVYKKIVKDVGASPQKPTPLGKEAAIASPKKRGKENSFDGKIDINTNIVSTTTVEEKPKKMKQEGLKRTTKGEKDDAGNAKPTKKMKTEDSKVTQIGDGTPKKPRILDEIDNEEEKDFEMKDLKKSDSEKDLGGLDCTKNQHHGPHNKMIIDSLKGFEADPLPVGKELTTVGGADLAPELVGDALQFLEFCATFGKILNLNKGQSEAVLREMVNGRSGRRGKYSTVVQFHIHLLAFLRTDSGEMSPTSSPAPDKSSWLKDLKDCISESHCVMDSMVLDHLDGKDGGYDALDFSQKIKILNFLCDEILGTAKIRNWIDDENTRFAEKEKEQKEKLNAAKDKEKQMKQKMIDEVAKAVIAKNGAPLTIAEHEALISEIKSEAAEAHAQMLESKNMISKKKQRCDAIRTDSIFVDDNGCAYWKLKCYSKETEIIRQDIGSGYIVSSDEKWFAYDIQQQKEIEKNISLRARMLRPHRVKRILPVKSNEATA